MFNSLTGRLSGHEFPILHLSTGGIEWALEVSAATFQSAIAAAHDADYRIYTYLHSREDLVRLYGFWSQAERHAFIELISVSGIGPRQALKILSGTSVESLGQSLEQGDVDALTRIPGLGKKTAQRLILQLKGHLVTGDSGGGTGAATEGNALRRELLDALTEMGFDRATAGSVLETVAVEIGADPAAPDRAHEQELFRRAIVALSGS
ncbi:MAG: Holliday junction branch migration protein RuvA [Spirochaeta sp.]|nr:Holliday junction branch migration protein RuvA [Spirochaeta sp.]